mgnify:CR=1 FL=1
MRMRLNNPMKRPEIIAKVQETRERTGANERVSKRNKRWWAEGKFTGAHRRMANSRGMNKTEAKLFGVIQPLGFRFTGDGTFWLQKTKSGIARNPDFIWGSGKKKTGLLLHGLYWHIQLKSNPETEIADYKAAGWNLFVLWISAKGYHLSNYMLPTITVEIAQWLNGLKSRRLRRPDIHQFSTSNAVLITTS